MNQPRNPREGALMMVRLGFKVFPLQPRSKIPFPGFKWGERCLEFTEDVIKNYTQSCNWAIACKPSNLFAVDVDNKNGRNGSGEWAKLEEEYGQTKTRTHRTPTGGFHIIFSGLGPTTTNKIADGIDTRSEGKEAGGYILCPGSLSERGEAYTIFDPTPLAKVPDWLLALANEGRVEPAPAIEISGLDTEENIKDAIAYLKSAPICVEGGDLFADGEAEVGGGGEYLLKVAFQVRDRGISENLCGELILTHYNDRCQPPWCFNVEEDETHFYAKIKNAYRHAQNKTIGSKSSEAVAARAHDDFADFNPPPDLQAKGPTTDATPAAEEEKTYDTRKLSDLDFNLTPRRDWVIYGCALAKCLTTVIAPGGVGKSTLSLAEALCVITGRPLLGYDIIQPGNAWLYNAEDSFDEMARRLEAMCIHHTIDPRTTPYQLHLQSGISGHKIIFAKDSRNGVLVNQKEVDRCKRFINRERIRVWFIDPCIQLHFCNENDNMAIDKVARILTNIADETNCAIVLIHHSNKAGMRADADAEDASLARGASALVNAARISFNLLPMSKEEAERLGGHYKDNRRSYFQRANAKANLTPKAEEAVWHRLVSTKLANGEYAGAIERANVQAVLAAEFEQSKFEIEKWLEHLIKVDAPVATRSFITAVHGTDPELLGVYSRKSEAKLLAVVGTLPGYRISETRPITISKLPTENE